jgi:gamma-glutamylcyclotransferase (GGCT)/AIG2-like uncharacterized protein YtfP
MANLFLYGTLCDTQLLEICLCKKLSDINVQPAILENHAVYWVKYQNYPTIIAKHDSRASGLLLSDLSERDIRHLNYYEADFNYQLRSQTVVVPLHQDGDMIGKISEFEATVYFNLTENVELGELWSLEAWAMNWGDIVRETAKEYMSYFGNQTPSKPSPSYQEIYDRILKNSSKH